MASRAVRRVGTRRPWTVSRPRPHFRRRAISQKPFRRRTRKGRGGAGAMPARAHLFRQHPPLPSRPRAAVRRGRDPPAPPRCKRLARPILRRRRRAGPSQADRLVRRVPWRFGTPAGKAPMPMAPWPHAFPDRRRAWPPAPCREAGWRHPRPSRRDAGSRPGIDGESPRGRRCWRGRRSRHETGLRLHCAGYGDNASGVAACHDACPRAPARRAIAHRGKAGTRAAAPAGTFRTVGKT